MKTIYRRYFKVTSGPIAIAAKALVDNHEEVRAKYLEILSGIGAEENYWHSEHRLIGFTPIGDKSMYRKVKDAGYYPKVKTKESRALRDRLRDVDKLVMRRHGEIMQMANEPSEIFSGMAIHFPTPTILNYDNDSPLVVFISVPWYDEDPEVIAEARKNASLGNRLTGEIRALLWEPSTEMKEVKEWEVLKDIENFNNRNKAK